MGDVPEVQADHEGGAVVTGELATAREQFLLEWGRETWKKSGEQAASSLQRLVTLNTALLGGTLAFPQGIQMHPGFRWTAAAWFLVSLAFAIYHGIAQTEPVDIDDPYAIEAYKERLTAERVWANRIAAGCLFVGLAVGLAGGLLRAIGT
jgi:hypothetical protein